jgi:hypothetical protein
MNSPRSIRHKEHSQLFDTILPKDPGKRDLVILALIVVPLMVVGVIWGVLGDFDGGSPNATPVPTPFVVQDSTPAATPSALFIIDAA